MNKKKNNKLWTVVAIALAVTSILVVAKQTKDYSWEDFELYIRSANPFWIFMAVVCTLLYIFFEGYAILRILKAFGYPKKVHKGFFYSAADIYFSAITPSASGGQPASAFFMMADGVPAGVSAVALMVNLVMYTASIMTIGIVAVVSKPELFIRFSGFSKFLIIIGYIILGGLMFFIILLLKKEKWVHAICNFFLKIFSKIRLIKRTDKLQKKLDSIIEEYKNCSEMIDGHRKMLFEVFVFNFLQRSLQICVSVMIYLADGGAFKNVVDIWATHAFAVIGSNCVPVPGAMGVIDYLLIDGMGNLMSAEDATSLELTSRGISFYFCVLLCLIIVGIGYFVINRRKEEISEDN